MEYHLVNLVSIGLPDRAYQVKPKNGAEICRPEPTGGEALVSEISRKEAVHGVDGGRGLWYNLICKGTPQTRSLLLSSPSGGGHWG
jgi:hypothetical protein